MSLIFVLDLAERDGETDETVFVLFAILYVLNLEVFCHFLARGKKPYCIVFDKKARFSNHHIEPLSRLDSPGVIS